MAGARLERLSSARAQEPIILMLREHSGERFSTALSSSVRFARRQNGAERASVGRSIAGGQMMPVGALNFPSLGLVNRMLAELGLPMGP
jgi:hypothetical protein